MNNLQIGQRIKYLSALLTLLDEKASQIEDFENIAQLIESYPEEMGVLIDEDRLKKVAGIGEHVGRILLHYTKSGSSPLEKELESRLPKGLPDLLRLPGLDGKQVQILWKEYGIETIESLNLACHAGQLSEMDGFGTTLERHLKDTIESRLNQKKDYHLDIAWSVAQKWLSQLENLDSIKQVELTGQMRRGNELIQSIEFVVEAQSSVLRAELASHFSTVTQDTSPIVFADDSGLPIRIWICTATDFQTCQLILSSGAAYLAQLDAKLAQKGLSRSGNRIDSLEVHRPGERGVCESIGLRWIEPELRDTHDHFQADQELIKVENVKGVFHAHSTWSDGRNSLEDLAAAAKVLGYQYLGISEHSQAAYYANGLKPDRVRAQWELIDKLNDDMSDFHIFKGIEADILQAGELDYNEELLAGFDFVIASVHSHFHLDSATQTDRIIRALQSPFTTILGHPTGRMLLSRDGYAPDLPAIIEAAAEYGKIIEINATPKRLDLDWRFLKLARSRGVKIAINPDAHTVEALKTIPLGVMMARKGGLTASDVLNTLNLDEVSSFLSQRRLW